MAEYALRMANGADTGPRIRMGDGLAQFPNGALRVRSGIRNDGGGVCTAVAGTMGVSVTPFVAFLQGGSSTAQGGYAYVNNAAKTLTLTDGHASLARVDVIAVVIKDDAFDASGATTATLQVVQGTPGAGAPALPATALPLREVNVPAGLSAGTGGLASANLGTDRRTYLPTGVMRVSGATERGTLTPQLGMTIYRTDTKVHEVYNGTGWDVLVTASTLTTSLPQAGTVTVLVPNINTRYTKVVTFPTPFAAAPAVTISPEVTGPELVEVSVSNVTATGFTIYAYRTSGSDFTCHWHAIAKS